MLLARRPLITLAEANIGRATTLAIYDFDGTLVHTPGPEEGRTAYEAATGKPWPHAGWWGEAASLEPPLTWTPNWSIIAAMKRDQASTHVHPVVVTGRPARERLIGRVQAILKDSGIRVVPGQTLLTKPMRVDTIDWKLKQIADVLRRMPKVRRLVVYEDRPEHAKAFEAHDFGVEALHVTVHKVPPPDPEGHWITIGHHPVFVGAR